MFYLFHSLMCDKFMRKMRDLLWWFSAYRPGTWILPVNNALEDKYTVYCILYCIPMEFLVWEQFISISLAYIPERISFLWNIISCKLQFKKRYFLSFYGFGVFDAKLLVSWKVRERSRNLLSLEHKLTRTLRQ